MSGSDTRLPSFLARVATIGDVPGLLYFFQTTMADYGFGVSSYHILSDKLFKREAEDSLVYHTFDEEWVDHYLSENLFENDPIIGYARRAQRPFHWFDIGKYVNLTPEHEKFLDDLRAQGFRDGLAVPVFGAQGSIAYFGLGCEEGGIDIKEEDELEIQIICQQTHIRYLEIENAAPAGAELSPRERDVLYWIAQGKSNSVIADILDISTHTVDTLVRRCYAKLGVSNRVSAAIKGVGSGLILP